MMYIFVAETLFVHLALNNNHMLRLELWCFNTSFNNISATLWQSVLLVEETGVPGENHRPVANLLTNFIT